MVGTCVNCGTEILKTNGIKYRPLGNYRSVKVTLEHGTKMEVPVCHDCHEGSLENLSSKIYEYIKSCPVSDRWTREQMDNYLSGFKDLKIKEIEKLGSLKAQDMENVKVWL